MGQCCDPLKMDLQGCVCACVCACSCMCGFVCMYMNVCITDMFVDSRRRKKQDLSLDNLFAGG